MYKNLLNNKNGFTLIELLTVIAIIGILSTLAIVSLRTAKERAAISNAQHDLAQLKNALTLLQNDTAMWPGHQVFNQSCVHLAGGCPANNEICGVDINLNNCVTSLGDDSSGLLANDAVTPYDKWEGPYLKASILTDPWGSEYFFDTDYLVTPDNEPCGCGIPATCRNVAVLGSYGPDMQGVPTDTIAGAYGCDDIILILAE